MASPAPPSDEEYQKGLDALSSLISGRVRSDGKNWSHAFEMMQLYLEVSCFAVLLLATTTYPSMLTMYLRPSPSRTLPCSA